MNNFDIIYANFDMQRFSPEELESFGQLCVHHFLITISRIRFADKANNRVFNFPKSSMGNISEYSANILLGVQHNGGYDAYIDLLDNFLLEIKKLRTDGSPADAVKRDLKLNISTVIRNTMMATQHRNQGFHIPND